jgi:hypothetical protein
MGGINLIHREVFSRGSFKNTRRFANEDARADEWLEHLQSELDYFLTELLLD